jgi:hypothetical protein
MLQSTRLVYSEGKRKCGENSDGETCVKQLGRKRRRRECSDKMDLGEVNLG